MPASPSACENARLATLRSLGVLDTPCEREMDDIARVAGALFDVPIALVSLVDEDRQWFKAKIGTELCETSRGVSFCTHTILESEPLVVVDTHLDPRFADNPLVVGQPNIRFYAGAPIVVDGFAVGAVCCKDHQPRTPSPRQIEALAALARQAASLFVTRRRATTFAESERRFVAFLDHSPAATFLKDAEGRMRYVSAAWSRSLGISPDAVMGRTSEEWMPKAMAASAIEHDESVRRGGVPVERDAVIPATDGTPLTWHTVKFPLTIGGETWVGGVALDVTAQRRAEATIERQSAALKHALREMGIAKKAAQTAAARFSQLFDGLPVACFTYGQSGKIHEWNAAAESMWGIRAEDVLLAPFLDTVVGPENRDHQEEVARRVFAGETVHSEERRETMRNGSDRWLLTSTFPLRTPGGAIVGAVSASVDVTERKRAEESLQEAKLFAESMAGSSTSMLYLVDFATKTQLWSNRELTETLGYDSGQLLADGEGLLTRIVHPGDRAAMTGLSEGLLDAANDEVVEAEVRFRHANGEWRWLWLRETVYRRGSDGVPSQIMGTAQDVTERKRMEAQLAEREARLRTVVESLHEGVLLMSAEGGFSLWNRSAEQILGLSGDQLADRSVFDPNWRTIHEDGSPFPPEEHAIVAALVTGEVQEPQVMGVCRPDGEQRWIAVNAAPVMPEGGGQPISAIASFLDVTERIERERFILRQMCQISDYSTELEVQKHELETMNARLEGLATTDGLTGLKNHRYFQDFLRRKIEHCQGAGLPISVALLDVDRFKSYNDDFGHQAGDAVLQGVAQVLESSVRDSDLVARYGGEEFVIVMPGLDAERGLAMADRIRARLAATSFELRAVTASFGVSTLGPFQADAASMIRAADEALYRSKERGRDRVTRWEPPTSDQLAA